MSKILKFVLIGVLGPIVMLIIVLIIKRVVENPSGRNLILKKAADMQFHGIVDSICIDRENHGARTLILSDKSVYPLYADWESLISKGDSLSKNKGELYVEVFKTNGRKIILNYKDLVQKLKLL